MANPGKICRSNDPMNPMKLTKLVETVLIHFRPTGVHYTRCVCARPSAQSHVSENGHNSWGTWYILIQLLCIICICFPHIPSGTRYWLIYVHHGSCTLRSVGYKCTSVHSGQSISRLHDRNTAQYGFSKHAQTWWMPIKIWFIVENKWAATRDFQQCGILTSVDSDEPVQSPLKLRNSKWCSVSSLVNTQWICKRLAKALISLRVCAGWSEPLLVAHTTLLEISCRGLNVTFLVWSLTAVI